MLTSDLEDHFGCVRYVGDKGDGSRDRRRVKEGRPCWTTFFCPAGADKRLHVQGYYHSLSDGVYRLQLLPPVSLMHYGDSSEES